MEDVDHAEPAVADQRADVGAEVDRDAVREAAVPGSRDPELLPRRAPGAVSGDDVARAHRPLRAVLAAAHDRDHAVGVLLERDDLAGVFEPRAERGCMTLQDRLEPDLRDEEPRRRAQVLDALVDLAEVPVELLPAERLDRHDRAVLDELGGGGLLDLRLQAEAAVDLDAALAHERRPRMNRGAGMPLDDERRNAAGRQEQRGREPDQAAADDQDRRLVRHCRAPAAAVPGRSPA